MDEFDVFMDAINRRVAMENLFSNSLEHPDLQFIFLTPQASAVCDSPDETDGRLQAELVRNV